MGVVLALSLAGGAEVFTVSVGEVFGGSFWSDMFKDEEVSVKFGDDFNEVLRVDSGGATFVDAATSF